MVNIIINTENLKIEGGQSYIIKEQINGNISGSYAIIANAAINEFTTSKLAIGNLFITKLDEINQIVAGTFWFNAVNENGDTVKVTDGRFDMQFTK